MTIRLPALALAALIAARAVAAQQPSTFVMLMGNDTLAVERVSRTASRLEGDFNAPSRGARVRTPS